MKDKPASFPIRRWAEDDKPRAKLVHKGQAVLSDAELIAILIGSGSREESAVELSKKIMASAQNSFHELGKLSISQLKQFKGIGEAKAVSIVAALEIGRRRRQQAALQLYGINSSQDAFELLHPLIGDLPHEEFWIVYLNNGNKAIYKGQLSKGGITGTLVDVRLVLKQALEIGAVALILAHNHPSGTLKPSVADKEITYKLKKAADSMDIKVLDHLIISHLGYFSFADEKII